MKLLIVDDEVIIRTGLCTVIPWADYGYELLEPAASAEEAIARLDAEQPNIIVTDIQMTGLTGLDLAREVTKRLPESEVIILSGYDQFKYAQKAIQEGVSDYLLKTSRPDEIMRAVGGARQRIIMRGESLKRDHLRDEVMEGLVTGREFDQSTWMQAKVLLPKLILHEPNSYLVLKIGAAGWGEDSSIQKLLLFAVHNVISELLEGEAVISGKKVVLVVRQSGDVSSLEQLEVEFARIEMKLKCKIYAGVGQLAETKEGLPHAYDTASYCYLFHGLLPLKRAITYEAIQGRKGGKTRISQEEERQLTAILAQRNEAHLRIWVEAIIGAQKEDNETTPNSLLSYIQSVLSSARNLLGWKSDGSESTQPLDSNNILSSLWNPIPLERVTTNADELLLGRLLEMMKADPLLSEQLNIPHINRAITYIHEHLSENPTLEHVANYVQLSASHFSEVFHRETGQEYSQYLQRIRTEKTK